jgi:5-amino-6-(5-phosphoribosylamino)uracil reductase
LRAQTRLVLAISLDGRLAPAGGGPAQLGGSGDRRALEQALAWADGCLIGASTLRQHGSTCLIRDGDLLDQRLSQGRPPQPTAIVVSRSGGFAAELPFFAQPIARWLLLAESGPGAPGFERQLPLPSWGQALEHLAGEGLQRLVVLGGAQLAASLLTANCIDALQLTLCPLLLGGEHTWLPATALLPEGLAGWRLEQHQDLGGDELLLHYGRVRPA